MEVSGQNDAVSTVPQPHSISTLPNWSGRILPGGKNLLSPLGAEQAVTDTASCMDVPSQQELCIEYSR
jgi:hypothetical protein